MFIQAISHTSNKTNSGNNTGIFVISWKVSIGNSYIRNKSGVNMNLYKNYTKTSNNCYIFDLENFTPSIFPLSYSRFYLKHGMSGCCMDDKWWLGWLVGSCWGLTLLHRIVGDSKIANDTNCCVLHFSGVIN